MSPGVRELYLRDALRTLIEHIDSCPRYISPGVGGQTIEANLKQTKIRNVSAWEVEQAREVLEND